MELKDIIKKEVLGTLNDNQNNLIIKNRGCGVTTSLRDYCVTRLMGDDCGKFKVLYVTHSLFSARQFLNDTHKATQSYTTNKANLRSLSLVNGGKELHVCSPISFQFTTIGNDYDLVIIDEIGLVGDSKGLYKILSNINKKVKIIGTYSWGLFGVNEGLHYLWLNNFSSLIHNHDKVKWGIINLTETKISCQLGKFDSLSNRLINSNMDIGKEGEEYIGILLGDGDYRLRVTNNERFYSQSEIEKCVDNVLEEMVEKKKGFHYWVIKPWNSIGSIQVDELIDKCECLGELYYERDGRCLISPVVIKSKDDSLTAKVISNKIFHNKKLDRTNFLIMKIDEPFDSNNVWWFAKDDFRVFMGGDDDLCREEIEFKVEPGDKMVAIICGAWTLTFFSHIEEGKDGEMLIVNDRGDKKILNKNIVPYNDYTKKLLGTLKLPQEYYVFDGLKEDEILIKTHVTC